MKLHPKQAVTIVSKEVVKTAEVAVDGIQNALSQTEKTLNSTIAPVRKSILKRFPTLFLLAVTFGVSLTFYGIEQFLANSHYFNGHPWVSFLAGICILVATGTFYKNLDRYEFF